MKMKITAVVILLLLALNSCVFGADDDIICPTSVENSASNYVVKH